MAKLTHKQIFNLLIKEINEVYGVADEDLNYFNEKVLYYLYQLPEIAYNRFKQDFIRDDDRISPTEQFLLDWAKDEWVEKKPNKELYQKFCIFLKGGKVEWNLYEKELPSENSENILKFDTLVSELEGIEYLDQFMLLAWLFYQPETLFYQCESLYFLEDDGKVDRNEQMLLDWIETEWIDKEGNEELADTIALHIAQKEMELGAKRFKRYLYR